MAEKSCFLGVDVGTTGAKALLINGDGRVLAEATHEYPLSTPRPLWSEQDPQDWWTATMQSITVVLQRASVDPHALGAVGLTGQMHGLVLLDGRGVALRPAILWNDQRTAAQCATITAKVGPQRVLQLTGNPVLPGFTAPKIAWVRENEPEVYERIAHVLLPKDYVRYRLTGAMCSDVSDASGTSLFDVGGRRWSSEMMDKLELPRAWFPEVTESTVASARVHRDAAAATGLLTGTPVVAGAGDQAAQAVGTGLVREGEVSATLGTSGVVFAASDSFRVEPEGRLHAFCHAVPGKWHLMGVMLSAAGSLRWFRDTIGEPEKQRAAERGGDAYDLLMELAEQAPPGCEELLFLPYLSGERTPHPDPHARGVYCGLTLRHGRAHMARAVLEGVCFGLRDALELMRDVGVKVDSVRVSGGGARSAFWRQMLADVFARPITTVSSTQGAAFGAALLAAVGAGRFDGVEAAVSAVVETAESVSPGDAQARYDALYPRYRALYPALQEEFAALARVGSDAS